MAEEVVLVETDDASVMGWVHTSGIGWDMALDGKWLVVLVRLMASSIVGLSPDEAAALLTLWYSWWTGGGTLRRKLTSPNMNIPQQTESGDVLSDVWVEDASSNSEAEGTGSKVWASRRQKLNKGKKWGRRNFVYFPTFNYCPANSGFTK